MDANDAFRRLASAGYLESLHGGFFRIVKPPKVRDLAWFVKAVKTLGAWSVDTDARPALVDIVTGTVTDEILFRPACRYASPISFAKITTSETAQRRRHAEKQSHGHD